METPTAKSPIQMKSPSVKPHTNDVNPGLNAGGRGACTASTLTEGETNAGARLKSGTGLVKKIHRAGLAFVHLARRLSASAYSRQVKLQPTRVPYSVQTAI
jgi:hypothetical protein